MSLIRFELTYDTVTKEFSVTETSTGEIKSVKASSKKAKKEVNESSEPILTLEDNKYRLNTAAVNLLGVEPDDKLDIKYEKQGTSIVPVIGNDENFGSHGGNRVTKTYTVAFRGSRNEELAKYGREFILIPHESKVGIFILKDKNAKEEITEEIEDLNDEDMMDIQDLIDDEDTEITEINSSLFSL